MINIIPHRFEFNNINQCVIKSEVGPAAIVSFEECVSNGFVAESIHLTLRYSTEIPECIPKLY